MIFLNENLVISLLCNLTVCRFEMGGIFTTKLSAEHETPPIANVLLPVGVISVLATI
jgi:hypothetical protein